MMGKGAYWDILVVHLYQLPCGAHLSSAYAVGRDNGICSLPIFNFQLVGMAGLIGR